MNSFLVAACILLPERAMLIPGAIALLASLGLFIIGRELRKAPEGFEDERGFHHTRDRRLRQKRLYRLHASSSNLPEGSRELVRN